MITSGQVDQIINKFKNDAYVKADYQDALMNALSESKEFAMFSGSAAAHILMGIRAGDVREVMVNISMAVQIGYEIAKAEQLGAVLPNNAKEVASA